MVMAIVYNFERGIMKTKKMTDRLEAVFTIVPTANAIGDIGTDHGYMAVELIRRGVAKFVVAGDVNKGPLSSATEYIHRVGLSNVIQCRLGNGLQVIDSNELQGAVICGMGGFLMIDIIKDGPSMLDFYVLQPQNGQGDLRKYIVSKGYKIVRDIIMTDMGKMYQAFLAIKETVLLQYVTTDGPITEGAVKLSHLYDEHSPESMLWEIGAIANVERPELWTAHVGHAIYQRNCAVEGMTEELAYTEKYKGLVKEIKELRSYIKSI